MTSGPITLWTGKEGQITVPEGDTVRSSNTDIVSVEKNGTAVTLTGGSKEGRAEVTAGESTWVVYNYASEAEYNYLYALFHEKRISVMGDSISTIKDKIPSGNALYYDNTTGKEMTFERNYWGDIITRFGAAEGIDEAWSGSTIGSKAASMASKDRINKLDDNGTPDVILYYGGSNPDSSVGAFDPDADYAKTVDWAQSYSDTASAYAASLQRMKATYAKAVAWAVENGITNGMTETTFAPNAACTRGQSVTFLHRALGKKVESSASFTDVKSDAFYADAINWAVANNVTNGTSATTFSPYASCTRAQIVTFLYRAYQGK